MSFLIPLSTVQSGTAIALSPAQDLFVADGVVIGSTGSSAVAGSGFDQRVIVAGTVVAGGAAPAIALGPGTESSARASVTVEAGGEVRALAIGPAIQISGTESTIRNAGLIAANGNDTIVLTGNGAESVTSIINSGTIANASGSVVAVRGSESVFLHNTGTISGPQSYDSGGGEDNILNTGTIVGRIEFGGGEDVYAGAGGRLNGKVFAGAGDDRIEGGIDDDGFLGEAGNDRLDGGGGNDELFGDTGDDVLIGGAEADVLDGGIGNDTLDGGVGDDTLVFASQAVLDGDDIAGGAGVDRVRFTATAAGETLTLSGTVREIEIAEIASGTTALNFNASAVKTGMQLIGNDGANVITGTIADDTIDGQGGIDSLNGGLGNDVYVLADGADTTSDSGGIDTITSTITRSLAGHTTIEGLTLTGTGAINGAGNGLANTITGNAAANILEGDGGNDTLIGGLGTDILRGGLGNDIYVLENGADAVSDTGGVDVITSTVTRSLAGFAAIEQLTLAGDAAISGTGNGLANVIIGNAAGNVLSGAAGKDKLLGGFGNDTLLGGLGYDTLTGGAGNDAFVFNTRLNRSTNRDIVTDFSNGPGNNDTIQLQNAVFSELTATGRLSARFFETGTRADDADDHIIYNRSKGALFYDADGNGAGAAIQFATITDHTRLTAADFFVI